MDASDRQRVMRGLADLRIGPTAAVISPERLQNLRGPNLRESPEYGGDELYEVEIEVRAPPGVPEQPLQAQIPFGLAGLAWSIRHPGEAWRLFLPVLA